MTGDQHTNHQRADVTFDAGEVKELCAAKRQYEPEEYKQFAVSDTSLGDTNDGLLTRVPNGFHVPSRSNS